jgi:hypothetical protein
MRVRRPAAAAVCLFGLVAAVSASAPQPALPEAAPRTATGTPALAGVIVRPGVIHVGRARAGPLSTAGCEQA